MKEWGRQHPWLAALVSGFILFLVQLVFRIYVLDQDESSALARSGVFAILFSIASGAAQSYQNRRTKGPVDNLRIFFTGVTFVLVLLYCFPYYGLDSDPPHYFNVFNQEIANHNALVAVVLAAISAGIVWFAFGEWRGLARMSKPTSRLLIGIVFAIVVFAGLFLVLSGNDQYGMHLLEGQYHQVSIEFASRPARPAFIVHNGDDDMVTMGFDYEIEANKRGDWTILSACPAFSRSIHLDPGEKTSPTELVRCEGTKRRPLDPGRYRVFKEFEINGTVAVAGRIFDINADGQLIPVGQAR